MFCLSIMVVWTLGGCTSSSDANADTEVTETTLETVAEIPLGDTTENSPTMVLEKFFDAMRNEDYSGAKDLVYNLEDNIFINDEMFEYVLKRCTFGWMVGNQIFEPVSYTESISENSATVKVAFKKDSESDATNYLFTFYMDESGEWKVTNDYFCCSDVLIATPKGVRFYLGDTEVPTLYKTKSDEAFDYYTIPLLPSYEYTTHIISSVFGDIQGTMSIPNNTEEESLTFRTEYQVPNREITEEFFNTIAVRLQEIYNGIYTDMDASQSASSLNKYLSMDTDYRLFATDYEQGVKNLQAAYNRKLDNDATIPTLVKVIRNKSVKSYVYTDSKIAMNVGFIINWQSNGETQSESFYTSMLLKYEGDFFLYELNSNSFTTFNPELHEFSNSGEVW